MKPIGILFIFLFVCHPPSYGQVPSLDSLEDMAYRGTTDSMKIEGLYKLCFNYLSIDPQKAVLYGEEALLLSNKVPNEIVLAP